MRFCLHSAKIPHIRAPTVVQPNVINVSFDGSKIVGILIAAAVKIRDVTVLHQSKYRLHGRSFNSQAEQVTILRALEQIQNLLLAENTEKIVVVFRDTKVTLDTLHN